MDRPLEAATHHAERPKMHCKSFFLVLLTSLLAHVAMAQPVARLSVSQFGITWTFDTEYPTGQFANGDYWVVGPVKVTGISPPSSDVAGRTKHGSMLNPSPKDGIQHGYDSTMPNCAYKETLNVALGVSASNPLVIKPNASLVSSISLDAAKVRPQIKTAAILTVLDKVPPAGSFRPAYCGDHKVKFNKSQLDFSKLERLKPVMNAPSLSAIERAFQRPWLDHVPGWQGDRAHPEDNMPNYGREMASMVGTGALMLNLDIANENKMNLLVSYVQLGIDAFGIVQDGGQNNWTPNGGIAQGRKFPILFAGVLLHDPAMSAIGQDTKTLFGEDAQTFYVRETSAGVYNNGYGGYTAEHKDMPEWGIRHATNPSQDDARWNGGNGYRLCCTANSFLGYVLVARLMGLKEAWNHDALFDYQDLYIAKMRNMNKPEWQISWSTFQLSMWDAYRKTVGTGGPTGLLAKVQLEHAFDLPTAQTAKKVVKLQWEAYGMSSEEVTYNLYRQEGNQPLMALRKNLVGLTYEDKAVKQGLTYVYVVRAVANQSESPPSPAVRVTL